MPTTRAFRIFVYAANGKKDDQQTQQQNVGAAAALIPTAVNINNETATVAFENGESVDLFIEQVSNEELKKFSPRKMATALAKIASNALEKKSQEDMDRSKKQANSIIDVTKKNAIHAYYEMPGQAGVFYIGIGILTALHLFANDASGNNVNPAAMIQHHMSQMSLVGLTGLYMFLATQGASAQMLNVWLKNPKFQKYIPFLAMSAGFYAQTFLSEFLTDPNTTACAMKMVGKPDWKTHTNSEDPCEDAFNMHVLQKRVIDSIPHLTAMLMTAYVMGKYTAKMAQKIKKFGMWRLALIVGGGFQLKGMTWLANQTLNVIGFTELQTHMEHFVSGVWKNAVDGNRANNAANDLLKQVLIAKGNKWENLTGSFECEKYKKENCNSTIFYMKNFSEKMSDFRKFNLTKTTDAYNSWSMYLQQLVGVYNASETFYKTFMLELKNVKYGESKNRLERTYPLFGVNQKAFAKEDDRFVTDPGIAERHQETTLTEVADYIDELLKKGNISERVLRSYPSKLEFFAKLRDYLRADDFDEKAKGYFLIEKTLRELSPVNTNGQITNYIFTIKEMLGPWTPLLEKGRGFMYSLEIAPAYNTVLKAVEFPKSQWSVPLDRPSDYFINQMVCGPDANENQAVIALTKGFPAMFLPPKIIYPNNKAEDFCRTVAVQRTLPANFLYTYDIEKGLYSLDRTDKVGVIEYLVRNSNPQIYGPKENEKAFEQWWQLKTESQMVQAFDMFGRQFQVVKNLLSDSMFEQNFSVFNSSKAAHNGIIKNIKQELKVYLMILGEIFKDNYESMKHDTVADKYFAEDKFQPRTVTNEFYQRGTSALLEAALDKNDPYNMDLRLTTRNSLYLTANWTGQREILNKKSYGKTLKFQKSLLEDFETVANWLKEINFSGVSPVENVKMMKKIKEVHDRLEYIAKLMGATGNTSAKQFEVAPEFLLPKEPREIVVYSLEKINGLFEELGILALMSNTANWMEIQGKLANGQTIKQYTDKLEQQVNKGQPSAPLNKVR